MRDTSAHGKREADGTHTLQHSDNYRQSCEDFAAFNENREQDQACEEGTSLRFFCLYGIRQRRARSARVDQG